ncbi:TetR/AcrR family transcriptional regulator [Consotaella salsifontis]|uniref:Transcriptional regulator, TetR family n=1 Tax=Consotaella salsifontis TaxID=1365950 RepID=A0A1T4Q5H3_9HYPH|nr:TetR/AcrR family transcriptional regulator [Consotaella salsifontis]SJZ98979.1 transcriptional regulator, TetR family [Consotaella salsifontis]
MKPRIERRRRGATLEDAILDAAWAELLEHGYTGFTMEAVAKRAGTSRPVLARRWESRAHLAIAAIGHYNECNPIEVPELGSVRDELVILLERLSDRGAGTMTRVLLNMTDYFIETGSSIAVIRDRIAGDDHLKEILQRGILRGELDPKKLTPRISTLALDLVRHEVIMTHKSVPRKRIEEIVDTIFLPLVTATTAESKSLSSGKASRSHRSNVR